MVVRLGGPSNGSGVAGQISRPVVVILFLENSCAQKSR
jgi:hypothetical protein